MNYKFKLVFLFILFSCHISIAQDNETKAQAYYMAAETAYGNGSFQSAFDKLTETEKALGNSNPKIEYLKVKCLVELKEYQKAKIELGKYFELAKENKGTAKYNEMLAVYGSIDDLNTEAKSSSNLQQQITELVSDMDATYKRCYYHAIQNEKRASYRKVDSVTLKDFTINCYYSNTQNENRISLGFSLLNIKQVAVTYPKGRDLYSINILYNDGKKTDFVFHNTSDGENCNRLAADIVKLGKLTSK